ncbi:MAG: DUF2442 domain-containing protein, partial [Acidobacteria bacterium]|nr:DUF2442 domain-containing protein [Acidobacteriota bacterium]
MDERRIKAIMDDPEFQRQVAAATKRGKEEHKRLPKASSARYDKKTRRIVLEMQNGVTLLVPVNLVQGLQDGSDTELGDFSLMLGGTEIHWNTLDVQFYVESFLKGVFGTAKWMSGLKEHLAEIGRKGGRSTSAAKKAASAE